MVWRNLEEVSRKVAKAQSHACGKDFLSPEIQNFAALRLCARTSIRMRRKTELLAGRFLSREESSGFGGILKRSRAKSLRRKAMHVEKIFRVLKSKTLRLCAKTSMFQNEE